eukprot:CAMPEP_0114990460 /NCGR_PEP_ID=MMETSP0216-20121206/10810_1 /TAXON_ID=223996 /ORGANISM="Protocruzia adherens, Strain Boccale" /LENGTH=541 /DNA_ID=CAMNT_0002353641 /DNA_START=34 /DNA_END=1660 /DNA_ORIENTATION=-
MSKINPTNELCCHILNEHFGLNVSTVAETLLLHGKLKIQEVSKASELSYEDTRNALVILMKQNMCQYFNESEENESATYVINAHEILLRLRYPMFIQHVRSVFGKKASLVLEEVMEWGRITAAECSSNINEKFENGNAVYEGISANFVRNVFITLMKLNNDSVKDFFHQEHKRKKAVTKRSRSSSLEKSNKKGRKTKKVKITESTANEEGLSKELLATLGVTNRPKEIEEDEEESKEEATKSQDPLTKKISIHEKNVLATDPLLFDEANQADYFFKINSTQFIFEKKIEVFYDLIGYKFEYRAGQIISSLMKNSRKIDRAEMHSQSEAVNFDTIRSLLPDNLKISARHLEQLLEVMNKEDPKFVFIQKNESSTESLYSINYKGIVEILQEKCLEKIVESKYGDYYGRVFRIVHRRGQIEERTVTDLCLLPFKDVRAILNNLYKDGLIQLQEVSTKSGLMIQLYAVKINKVKELVIQQTYRAIVNLRVRLSHQMQKIAELQRNLNVNDPEEGMKLEKQRMIEAQLRSCLVELDENVMILHDF